MKITTPLLALALAAITIPLSSYAESDKTIAAINVRMLHMASASIFMNDLAQ